MELGVIEDKREELMRESMRIGKAIRAIDRMLINDGNRKYRNVKAPKVGISNMERINLILDCVSEVFNLNEADYLSARRLRELVQARHCAFYVAAKSCSCSLQVIGALFSSYRDKVIDHATIIHGVNRVESAIYIKNKTGKDPDGYATKCEQVVQLYLSRKSEL